MKKENRYGIIKWVGSYEKEIYMENINGIMDDIYLYHVIDE